LPDNPAARLLAFVTDFRALPGKRNTDGLTTGNAVAILLEIGQDDPARLSRELALILDLSRQAREAIVRSEAIPDRFAVELDAVDLWLRFSNTLGTPATGPARSITDEMVKALTMCSELLSLHAHEMTPTVEQLRTMREGVNDLLSRVAAADFDDAELGHLLTYHLHRILEALDTYRFTGRGPSRAAVAEAFGDLALRQWANPEPTDNDKAWLTRFFDVVGRVVDVGTLFDFSLRVGTFIAALGAGRPH